MSAKTARGKRLEHIWLNYVMRYETQVGQKIRVHWRDSLHKTNKVHEGELLEVKPMGLCLETKDSDEIFVTFMGIRALEKYEQKDYKCQKAITTPEPDAFALPVEEAPCPTCKGRKTIDKPAPAIGELLCPQCLGTGIVYV